MAYDITNDSFLATTKIDLTAEMGEGAFVELREPSKKEFLMLAMSREGNDMEVASKFSAKFSEILPALITGHGFTAGGKPASNEQVRDAIGKRMTAQNKVEAEYITWASSPFQKPSEYRLKA